ncbi:MAG: TfpX/TfpZ family type IV pilin accessory protein [Burkholderiaceae bacterium]
MTDWKDRLPARVWAALIHLGLSLLIAALASALVFGLWYPYPYREISGGRELFLIVVAVDVILGPLLTLTVFNLKKPRKELRRDLGVIGLLQLLALCYGLWTVFVARPVHLVFEIDRFRVVHAIEIPEDFTGKLAEDINAQPLWGPGMLSVRPFKDAAESFEATQVALSGIPLAAQPGLWEPYSQARERVLKEAKPVDALKKRFPAQAAAIDTLLAEHLAPNKAKPAALVYLPMVGRKSFWTVFIDPHTAQVVAFMPLDSF